MSNMVDTHVRFNKEAYDAITEIACENNISIARLVRASVEMNLAEYLRKVIYLDSEQGDAIYREINMLTQETAKVKIELNRIGVNINQCVKEMHSASALDKMMMQKQIGSLQEQLDEVMKIYKETVYRQSTVLWRVQR